MRNAIRGCASGRQLIASVGEGLQGRVESNLLSLRIAVISGLKEGGRAGPPVSQRAACAVVIRARCALVLALGDST